MAELTARNNQTALLSSKNKLDVGMVKNATVGSAKYISRKLGF